MPRWALIAAFLVAGWLASLAGHGYAQSVEGFYRGRGGSVTLHPSTSLPKRRVARFLIENCSLNSWQMSVQCLVHCSLIKFL